MASTVCIITRVLQQATIWQLMQRPETVFSEWRAFGIFDTIVKYSLSCTEYRQQLNWLYNELSVKLSEYLNIMEHLGNGERPQTVYSVKRMYVQGALAPGTYILSTSRLFEAFLKLKTLPNSYKFQFYTGIITD